MWWAKCSVLIVIAAFIDLAGVGISWALLALGAGAQAITPVGSGFLGAFGAAYYCYNASSNLISGVTNAIQCGVAGGILGSVTGVIGVPLGIALGEAITVCLSAMGVALLIMPMLLMGMFYPKYLISPLGKLVPVLNWLPFLSAFVIACIVQKRSEEKKRGFSSTASQVVRLVTAPETAAGTILGAATAINASKQKIASDVRPPQRNYEQVAA